MQGFTLLELMVVVAIVAILASIALPAYNDYVTRSKLVEAQNTLSNYYVQMEQYFQDNRSYGRTACGVDPPTAAARYFVFSCQLDGNGGFVATAEGNRDRGAQGFRFTIDQSNTRSTTDVPAGWRLPGVDCWVTNKNGACT